MITILYNKATAKAMLKEKMSARLSGECCTVDALWFKVMRTLVSPMEIEPVKMLSFFVLYFVRCNKSELVLNFQL